MFLDFTYVVPSVLIGIGLGFFAGLFVAQFTIDSLGSRIAQATFDTMLKLREQARTQMAQHDANTKGRSNYEIRR